MEPKEILKSMIQRHMAYPDKTAYKIADQALSELASWVREKKIKGKISGFGSVSAKAYYKKIHDDALESLAKELER